tara:strand:+ start:18726 stop:19655 length:930 start_codon:yes stop_codon:yes gene_type:complete
MSQGLAQYEQTVSSFGNATDSIKAFTSNYDTEFFRDWTEKHNLKMEQLKSASDVSGGIGGAFIAGKMGYGAYQKRKLARKKKQEEDDKDDDDNDKETPDNEGDENGNEAQETGQEEEEEVTGFGDDADAEAEQGVSLDTEGVLENIPSTTSRFGFNLDRDAPEQAEPPPDEAPPVEQAPEIPSAETAPSADMSAGIEAGTFESGVGGTVTSAPVSEAVAGGTSEAVAGAGADAGASALTDGLLTVAGGVADAIPFLGIFASIGIGLYELFHHPHKAPSAPPVATASSKGEMVLPSFDSVTDTPASSSAF